MRVSIVLLLVGAACANHVAVDGNLNYHQRVGIPLAAEIKTAEDALFKNGTSRIVGGISSPINNHPYLAGLVINFVNIAGQSVCGASLLTANRLLTAGHCWFDGTNQASQFTVVLGSEFLFWGGTRLVTSTVITHPSYNALVSNIVNDVAIIYLPSAVPLSSQIQPVALPSTLDLNQQWTGEWAVATGYGKTTDLEAGVSASTFRREVNLQVITLAQCQAVYGSATVLTSNICTNGAGGVGVCGGDSGGPLTIVRNGQRVLVGVSSFVAFNACHLGFPSAFARVTSFYDFILQHLF